MSETVQANDGAMLPLSSLQTQLVFSGGFISTISVLYQGKTYTQTFLNDGVHIYFISGWINPDYTPLHGIIMVDQSGDIMVDQSGQIMVTQ